MTSRREFISNTFGIALVTASTWPIRAGQAHSTQQQSDTSTSKAGRTTRKTSLNWDVFLAGSIPVLGGQHTCHHERFTSRGNAASVAADFVNAYFWGARRCPGRHPHHRRAGASTGELGLLRAERI